MLAVPALVRAWDAIDPAISRNLLAHVRRVAEQSEGRLPTFLPARPKETLPAVTSETLVANHASYLLALHQHWLAQGDQAWLKEQQAAIQLCAEALVRLRWEDPQATQLATVQTSIAVSLQYAVELAEVVGDELNAVRWKSEVQVLARGGLPERVNAAGDGPWSRWLAGTSRQAVEQQPWRFAPPAEGIGLAGDAVWMGCGLHWRASELWVEPAWPGAWGWWALLSLPLIGDKYSEPVMGWANAARHPTRAQRLSSGGAQPNPDAPCRRV